MAFSSLFIGATGLMAHSDGMQVISNNLANVSTTAYKQADTLFETMISQQMATGSNRAGANAIYASQKGMGVALGAVKTSFRQGVQNPSSTTTDMSLEGNGFFSVVDPDTGTSYYTRDGTFRFDTEGYLLNKSGLRVQGSAIDRATGALGSLGDIQLDLQDYVNGAGQTFRAVQSLPKATTYMTMNGNLDSESSDETTSATNPFFAMFESWNGLAESPMAKPSFTSTMNVYDANGEKHTLTFSFDEVSSTGLSNATPGQSYWEYTLTMDPSEEGRASFMNTSAAGMLAFGTLAFNDGILTDMTAFTFSATGTDPKNLSNWAPASFDANGRPSFDVSFAASGATTATQTVGFDFGMTSTSGSWATGGASNASMVGLNAAALGNMADQDKDAFVITNYNKGSSTYFATQDGYAQGFLQSMDVDRDGTMIGHFSNGQNEGLFKVGVYRFVNDYGLHREGGNLFQATTDSGSAIEGYAQEGGRGAINGSSLEMSNVDMAQQFVRLIVTQRGLQSNTKVITTSDSILNTAISIKR